MSASVLESQSPPKAQGAATETMAGGCRPQLHDPNTNVTGDDRSVTGKIALAHLNEFSDYYTRLDRMETEANQAAGKEKCGTQTR